MGRVLLSVLVAIWMASAAHAETIAETMSGPPQRTVIISKPLNQVERCLVMSYLFVITAYRTPDKPNSSLLLHRSAYGETRLIWELTEANGATKLVAWEGSRFLKTAPQCLS